MPRSSASRLPLVPAKLADALVNPPVWNQTRTGAGSSGVRSRVQMFMNRQSSTPVGVPDGCWTCAHTGEAVVALTTAGAQGARGCGGFHRLAPPVGAAYGTPRKAQEVAKSRPWTSPRVRRRQAGGGLGVVPVR